MSSKEEPLPTSRPLQPSPVLPTPKSRPHRYRKLILVIVALVMVVATFTAAYFWFTSRSTSLPTDQSAESPSQSRTESAKVRIIASGDVIAHDVLNAAAKQADDNYDYYQFMQNMQPYFDAAQVRFCNQATLAGGSQFGLSGYPSFNAPKELSRDMAKLGCNLINTGSNHANDKTQAVINASVATWDDQPGILVVAGANRSAQERDKVRYFDVEEVRFAFVSYTTYLNSPNKQPYSVTMYNEALVKRQLAEAKQNADVVIVSMRWGTEYSGGINASQESQSQFLADNGADIVFGHGPHVVEPVKKLQGKKGDTYVWYSLGNFLNAQLEAEALVNGLAVMEVDKTTKKVSLEGYLPIYMHYEWTAQQKAAQDLMARRNFAMYLLEESAEPLARSQANTTVEAQTARLQKTLNMYTKVPLLKKQDYLSN